MRESFILHSEYIEDLPEEYKSVFLMYAYNYGVKGEVPNLTGLEQTIWLKIQRRIDYDFESWEETKNVRSEAGRIGGIKSGLVRSKKKQNEANEAQLNLLKANEANEAVNVSVNVSVNDDGDESESVGETAENGENQPSPPSPPSKMSDSQENYSRIVFDKFKNVGLPCQKGDFFRFQSCDFRLALQKLKGIPSQDVISAVDNYIAELRNPESYIDKEFSFDAFVASKTFSNCLPANYRPNNFKKFAKDVPKDTGPEPPKAFKCDVCGQIAATWNEKLMKWHCTACGADFD